ncbi:helix-turn-helix transcriptional regulator [Natrialbaceae archaeon A-arb3/5]
MNFHFRHQVPSIAVVASTSDFYTDGYQSAPVSPVSEPLLIGGGPHFAALAGIAALAVLGSVLIVRNRLESHQSRADGQEQRRGEFVTDRERIQQLVTENGGRMKQSKIVDSVDWSKAKVSRLLAELEEDDQVTKLRLGRENLVCLPDHEPTASKVPEQGNDD